jgi:hypothetical protein
MKIYLATWLEDNQGVTLTEAKCKNRLMSYFFIGQGKFDIRTYVKTGLGKAQWLKSKHRRRQN